MGVWFGESGWGVPSGRLGAKPWALGPHSTYMTFFTAAIVFAASGLAERSRFFA